MSSTTEQPQSAQQNSGGEQEKPRIDRTVFSISLALVVVFCALGAIWPDSVDAIGGDILTWLVDKVGWVYVLAATGFVVFAIWLALSKYGRIPLSRNAEPPEFSTISWIAMMFSAGMGIGLIFYGVYEPVAQMANPAPDSGVQPNTPDAATNAMSYTFFHWGFHPWAIYAVVALALAYSTFRMGRGNLISAPFQSMSPHKEVEYTWWGRFVNIWSIIATKFGGATSLGLGALQIAGGIALLTPLSGGFGGEGGTSNVAFLVIVVLVIFALLSAISGVGKGIKWLSNTNMVLAALLMLFVLIVGPTVFIFDMIPVAFGEYLIDLIPMSFQAPLFGGNDWFESWTIFYWAWWISWAPFVATFIARISRGRTIREFVFGVLFVPTIVSALWFIVFGGAGIHLQLPVQFGGQGIDIAGTGGAAQGFFTALQNYPAYTATAIVVMILVAIFWVSGADASALVLATLSSHGVKEPNKYLIALWAALSAAVACVLLYVGGLGALQTFTVIVAAPFVIVMILFCAALMVDLRRDPLRERRLGPVRGHVAPDAAVTTGEQAPTTNGAVGAGRNVAPGGEALAEMEDTGNGTASGMPRPTGSGMPRPAGSSGPPAKSTTQN